MRTMWLWTLTVLTGLAVFGPAVIAQSQKESDKASNKSNKSSSPKPKVQSFISAQKQLAPLAGKLEAAGEKPDPALQSQLEQIAKSNGFSSLDELHVVALNIALVLDGLDPQTGQFMERSEQIKKDMDELKQDGQISQKDKDQALSQMQEELESAAPLQFKENVALVRKSKEISIKQSSKRLRRRSQQRSNRPQSRCRLIRDFELDIQDASKAAGRRGPRRYRSLIALGTLWRRRRLSVVIPIVSATQPVAG